MKTKNCGKTVHKKVLLGVSTSLYPEHPDHERKMITSHSGCDKTEGVKTLMSRWRSLARREENDHPRFKGTILQ